MCKNTFSSMKAAVVIENGCCEREVNQAVLALQEMGIKSHFISAGSKVVKSWNEEKNNQHLSNWAQDYAVSAVLSDVVPSNYDILVVPGGRRSIEKLELNQSLRTFLSGFVNTGKPVIAYNNAITLLSDLGLISGYSVAATSRVCDDVKRNGVRCAAPEFIVCRNLITMSRYRNAEGKISRAITSVLNSEPYVELVSSDNIPRAHSAA